MIMVTVNVEMKEIITHKVIVMENMPIEKIIKIIILSWLVFVITVNCQIISKMIVRKEGKTMQSM